MDSSHFFLFTIDSIHNASSCKQVLSLVYVDVVDDVKEPGTRKEYEKKGVRSSGDVGFFL